MPAARANHPARRTDAGTVKITDRDMTGLTLRVGQYGAPTTCSPQLRGVREKRLRGSIARWRHPAWADRPAYPRS